MNNQIELVHNGRYLINIGDSYEAELGTYIKPHDLFMLDGGMMISRNQINNIMREMRDNGPLNNGLLCRVNYLIGDDIPIGDGTYMSERYHRISLARWNAKEMCFVTVDFSGLFEPEIVRLDRVLSYQVQHK